MRCKVDKLEKIRQIEYDLDRIRSLVERVDERANGVMYASGALAMFYVALLALMANDIDLELLVANPSPFVFLLFLSSVCSMVAFVLSIFSIYPIPFNVVHPETFLFCWDNVPGEDWNRLRNFLRDDLNIGWVENVTIPQKDGHKIIRISNYENSDEITIKKKKKKAILKIRDGRTQTYKLKVDDKLNIYGRTKGKKGKTTSENFKEGGGTSSKSKILEILEFRDGTKMEIIFEPRFKSKSKMIEKPNPEESAESCQNMNVDKILYFKCATLHGQKLAVVRKYNWLRWALIVLTVSVVFLFVIPVLCLISEFIPGLVC